MLGFVRNQWLSLPFRKEHVESGKGDGWHGYVEDDHNHIAGPASLKTVA